MAPFKNHYKTLALEVFADAEAVKAAYRRMARQYHPDLNADNPEAEEQFKRVNEAYEILGDKERKAQYDQSLRVLLQQSATERTAGTKTPRDKKAASAHKPDTPKPPPKEKGSATSINDLFETFLKQHNPGSADRREKDGDPATGTTFRNKPQRGKDVTVEASITPQEAEHGVVKTVNVQHNEVCRRCSGTGKVNQARCTACHGEKIIVRLKKIDVRIPGGVRHGSKVRVTAEGGRGVEGGDNGDLFLLIHIAPEAALRVEGANVHYELALSIPEAVLGTELEVPTLTGRVKMTIPPLTSSGKVFRLREMGVQNGAQRGDQLVTVMIQSPSALTPREKELYEALARLKASPGELT